jgi:hypothetical protein
MINFHRFMQIINESKGINEWDPNEPDEGPESNYESTWGEHEIIVNLTFKNGTFHDIDDNRSLPPIPHPNIQTIIGSPGDTYTMKVRIVASGEYAPGYDAGGGNSENDKFHGEPKMEVDGASIENDMTKKSIDIPSNLIQDKVVGEFGSNAAYQVAYEVRGGKIEFEVN